MGVWVGVVAEWVLTVYLQLWAPVVPIVYLVVSGPKCVCVYPTSPVCSVLWLRCTNLWGSVGLEV